MTDLSNGYICEGGSGEQFRWDLHKKIIAIKTQISRYDAGNYTCDEEDTYRDLLDSQHYVYDPTGSRPYPYSEVLENCDPDVFREGLEEYYDSKYIRKPLEDNLNRLECELKDFDFPGWDNEEVECEKSEDEDEDEDENDED